MLTHWPGTNVIGCPSSALEHELPDARRQRPGLREASFEGRRAAGPSPHYLGPFAARRTGLGAPRRLSRKRLRAVRVRCLHARERAQRSLHAKERVERVVRRHAGSRARPSDLLDGRGRVRRMEHRARQERDAPAPDLLGARRRPARRRAGPRAASSSARDASSSSVTTSSAPLQTSTRTLAARGLRRCGAPRRDARAGRGPGARARAVRATRGPRPGGRSRRLVRSARA